MRADCCEGYLSHCLEAVQPVEEGTARGNVRINGRNVTQALKQYIPMGGDGHEVLFTNPQVQADLSFFMRELLVGEGIPGIAP